MLNNQNLKLIFIIRNLKLILIIRNYMLAKEKVNFIFLLIHYFQYSVKCLSVTMHVPMRAHVLYPHLIYFLVASSVRFIVNLLFLFL